jgi:hypothetical protein
VLEIYESDRRADPRSKVGQHEKCAEGGDGTRREEMGRVETDGSLTGQREAAFRGLIDRNKDCNKEAALQGLMDRNKDPVVGQGLAEISASGSGGVGEGQGAGGTEGVGQGVEAVLPRLTRDGSSEITYAAYVDIHDAVCRDLNSDDLVPCPKSKPLFPKPETRNPKP